MTTQNNWPPEGFRPYRPDENDPDKMLAIRLPRDKYSTRLSLKDTDETPANATIGQKLLQFVRKFWPF